MNNELYFTSYIWNTSANIYKLKDDNTLELKKEVKDIDAINKLIIDKEGNYLITATEYYEKEDNEYLKQFLIKYDNNFNEQKRIFLDNFIESTYSDMNISKIETLGEYYLYFSYKIKDNYYLPTLFVLNKDLDKELEVPFEHENLSKAEGYITDYFITNNKIYVSGGMGHVYHSNKAVFLLRFEQIFEEQNNEETLLENKKEEDKKEEEVKSPETINGVSIVLIIIMILSGTYMVIQIRRKIKEELF